MCVLVHAHAHVHVHAHAHVHVHVHVHVRIFNRHPRRLARPARAGRSAGHEARGTALAFGYFTLRSVMRAFLVVLIVPDAVGKYISYALILFIK